MIKPTYTIIGGPSKRADVVFTRALHFSLAHFCARNAQKPSKTPKNTFSFIKNHYHLLHNILSQIYANFKPTLQIFLVQNFNWLCQSWEFWSFFTYYNSWHFLPVTYCDLILIDPCCPLDYLHFGTNYDYVALIPTEWQRNYWDLHECGELRRAHRLGVPRSRGTSLQATPMDTVPDTWVRELVNGALWLVERILDFHQLFWEYWHVIGLKSVFGGKKNASVWNLGPPIFWCFGISV